MLEAEDEICLVKKVTLVQNVIGTNLRCEGLATCWGMEPPCSCWPAVATSRPSPDECWGACWDQAQEASSEDRLQLRQRRRKKNTQTATGKEEIVTRKATFAWITKALFLRLSAVRLNTDELACPLNQSSDNMLLHKTNKTQVTHITSCAWLKLLISAVQWKQRTCSDDTLEIHAFLWITMLHNSGRLPLKRDIVVTR